MGPGEAGLKWRGGAGWSCCATAPMVALATAGARSCGIAGGGMGGLPVSQETQTTFVGLGRERPLGWRLALLGRAAATSAGLAGPSPENDMRLDLIHSVSSGSDLH